MSKKKPKQDAGAGLEPDHGQIWQFVDAIFLRAKLDGFISLRAFYQDGTKPFRITPLNVRSDGRSWDRATTHRVAEAATEEAGYAAQEPKAVNFCPPLAIFNNDDHARQEDISQGLVISVEADSNPKQAREKLEAILGPATVVVESGGLWTNPETGEVEPKLHLHWRLADPAVGEEDLSKLKQARTLASSLVGGDQSNNPINHPIRWPGSWHRKAEPRLAKIIAIDDETEIELNEALAALEKAAGENPKAGPKKPHESGAFAQSDPKFVAIAVNNIPNDWEKPEDSWPEWVRIGMAIYRATAGAEAGREIFHAFSKRSKQDRYNEDNTNKKWDGFHKSPPTRIGAGTLFHLAWENNRGWRDELDHAYNEFDREFEARFSSGPTEKVKSEAKPKAEPEAAPTLEVEPQAEPEPEPAAPKADVLFDPWAKVVVPAFPFNVLPGVLKDFVEGSSAVIGCDPSGLAMAVLAACSGALDHRFAFKMMKHGDWWASPRLWPLLYGTSSDKKTQMMNSATGPAERYQAEILRAYYEVKAEYERQLKSGNKEADKPLPPPRYVVYDVTIEKLGEILSRSPRGTLVKQDEVAGWIGGMERYGRGKGAADRAFWLKAHDGGPYAMDRISRGEIFIENLSTTLIAGIQPKRLAELKGLTSDGLLQRFLPVVLREGEFTLDRPIDDQDYNKFIRALIKSDPWRLYLPDEGMKALEALRKELHEIERASIGLAEGFSSFIGKLPLAAGALTIILHMADWALKEQSRDVAQVNPSTIGKVQRIVTDFLVPHGMEFYRTTETVTDGDRIQQLASYILTSGKKRFLASDFASNVASMRGLGLKEINERVSPLVAAGWLDPEGYRNLIVNAWTVDSDVAGQFTERRKAEEERKAALAALIGSQRKSG